MVRKQPEIRRQELLQIATRQFISQGYDKTSIRSIVGEVGGEIGMFYHHFASKDEIFRAVLEEFNTEYIRRTRALIEKESGQTFPELFDRLLEVLENSLSAYLEMDIEKADARMLAILHQNTLTTLRPTIGDMISKYTRSGEISPPSEIDAHILAQFLLFGISSVLHDRSQTDMTAKNEAVKVLSYRLLGVRLLSDVQERT